MNWERVQGNWKQLHGKAKEQWGKLTHDDLDVVAGRRDQLCGKIQERYGVAKDEADKQLKHFESRSDRYDYVEQWHLAARRLPLTI